MTDIFIRRGNLDIDTHRGKMMWGQPSLSQESEFWSRPFSHSPNKEPTLSTPWPQTPSLQYCEKNILLLFKPPRLPSLLVAVLATNILVSDNSLWRRLETAHRIFCLMRSHFLALCVCVHVCLVAQSCPTLLRPRGLYSPPGFSVHGIFQQEYWNGLPSPPPGGLPDPGIECISLKTHQVNTIKKWW